MKKKKSTRKKINNSDRIIKGIIAAVVIFAVLALGYSIKTIFFPEKLNSQVTQTMNTPTMGRMGLTGYDKELAKKMMDKNNDGKCDACGMPVDMCIDSGQLQCNMDPKSTIGVLGAQHIHADWKVYINEQLLDFNGKDHMTRMKSGSSVSSFIHVDSGAPAPEKTGNIIHMHAKGTPLWIFFDSINIELPNTVKVYVNGELKLEGLNYVFSDLDKILITDGNGDLQEQLNSITDFAEIH